MLDNTAMEARMKGLRIAFAILGLATLLVALWLVRHRSDSGARDVPARSSAEVAAATGGLNPPTLPVKRIPQPSVDAGGRGVHALFRSPQPKRLPPGNVKAQLPGLERQAFSGDAALAYALADALHDCRAMVEDPQNPSMDDPSTTASVRCAGLERADYDKMPLLLEYAAEHGDINAQVAYVGMMGAEIESNPALALSPEAVAEYRVKSLHYLTTAAQQGSIDAMLQLADVYKAGTLVAADPVMAYAYTLAVAHGTGSRGWQRVADQQRSEMTPSEVEAAEKLASQILDHCCGH